MQDDDDQIVPYKDGVLLQAKAIKNAKLKVYEGYPHGMLTINADVINNDILHLRLRTVVPDVNDIALRVVVKRLGTDSGSPT
jgi:hypothetical protein